MRVSRILLWLALLLVLFLVAACAQDTVLWKNPKPIQGPGINPSDEADNPPRYHYRGRFAANVHAL